MEDLITRALVIITIAFVAIVVTAGLGQLVLSWQYRYGSITVECPKCHGEKSMRKIGGMRPDGKAILIRRQCDACKGTGLVKQKRDR